MELGNYLRHWCSRMCVHVTKLLWNWLLECSCETGLSSLAWGSSAINYCFQLQLCSSCLAARERKHNERTAERRSWAIEPGVVIPQCHNGAWWPRLIRRKTPTPVRLLANDSLGKLASLCCHLFDYNNCTRNQKLRRKAWGTRRWTNAARKTARRLLGSGLGDVLKCQQQQTAEQRSYQHLSTQCGRSSATTHTVHSR